MFVRHAGHNPWRLALTIVLLLPAAAAQSAGGFALAPPAPRLSESTTVATRQVQSAIIAGHVTDAETRQPIADAVVVITDDETGSQKVGVTDASGRYEVANLRDATYRLRTSALGYVGRRYGQRHALDIGSAVALGPAQSLGNIDFVLRRGGTISGRVFDAAGNPMELAEVEALRPQLQRNQRVLVPIRRAPSNASGAFSITGLPPGSYYIGAFDPATEGRIDARGQILWSHTFYPGVTSAVDARRVPLSSGGLVSAIEFEVQTVAQVRVGGRLLSPQGSDLRSGAVTLSPESRGGVDLGPTLAATVTPNGQFEFEQVPAGTYRIRAQASDYSSLAAVFGTLFITVEGNDLTNLALSLNRGTRLEGQIELVPSAGTSPPADLSGIWVNTPMADGALSWGMATTRAAGDGTFRFDSPEGARVIRLRELPPPWTLDRVLHRGRDITDSPLDFVQGASHTAVRVILTDRSGRLTGLVTDASGEPVREPAGGGLASQPLPPTTRKPARAARLPRP